MKLTTVTLAMLLSVALFHSAHAQKANLAAAVCPLYEIYPYPPNYMYYCDYYSDPAGDCNMNAQQTYYVGNFPTVPYTNCSHCDDPNELTSGEKKRNAVDKAPEAANQPKPKGREHANANTVKRRDDGFGGLPDPIVEDYKYDVPPGPDRTGPDGRPDGIPDAQQYSSVKEKFGGKYAIAKLEVEGREAIYVKVFEVTLKLKERSGDKFKGNPVEVIYVGLQLGDHKKFEKNCELRNIRPGDDREDCHCFFGECVIPDREPRPIMILTAVRRD